MPLNVAGKQLSNGAIVVAGGLIVGLVDTFLPWHTTTFPTVLGGASGGHDVVGRAVLPGGHGGYRAIRRPHLRPSREHAGSFLGIITAAAVAVGGYLMRSDPQPATRPLSSYQPSATPAPPPAMPPPAAPPPPPTT